MSIFNGSTQHMCKYKIQETVLMHSPLLAVFLREMKLFCTLVALGTVLLGPTAVFAQDGLEDSILTALRLVTDMSYATQEYVSRLSISNMPAEGPVREELPRVSNVYHIAIMHSPTSLGSRAGPGRHPRHVRYGGSHLD